MKTQGKISVLALVVLAVGAAGAVQAADIVGTQTSTSGTPYIKVGESQVYVPGIHYPNKAGVGVSDFAAGLKIDFDGLSGASSTTHSDLGDDMTRYDYGGSEEHGYLGTFTFVKVGSGDVWYGEWSSDGSPDYTNRQAFYVGDRTGVSLPTATATYAVTGINQGNVLNGTLTATFGGTNTLNGTLSRSGLAISIVNAAINTTDASFSGGNNSAIANGTVSGSVTGNFFGAGATALAGVANFGTDSVYNTGFGGTKN